MKITIKATFIDTGGHGYLSISKKDLIAIDYPYEKISGFSGHNLTRVFLEEDCDATNFLNFCEKNNIEVKIKKTYNTKFNITHNFDPKLFNSKFKVGDKYILNDNSVGEITYNNSRYILISISGIKYRLPKTNPYKYVVEQVE